MSNNLSPDDCWLSFHLLNPVTLKSLVSNVPAGSGCSASPVTAAGPALSEGPTTDAMLCKHGIIRPLCWCYLSIIPSASLLLAGFLIKAGATGGQFKANS